MSSSNLFEDVFADVDLPLLHQRTYQIRGYRKDLRHLLLRGVVQDLGQMSSLPAEVGAMEIHRMVVDLVVDITTTDIVDVTVLFESHPHEQCVRIIDHYDSLVGLAIGRGYTHRVRELFGGPRGCTHVLALLQAMAPVVMQARWPMFAMSSAEGKGQPVGSPMMMSAEDRRQMSLGNLNTCHVWAEGGELITAINEGHDMPMPVNMERRLRELGMDPDVWRQAQGGDA